MQVLSPLCFVVNFFTFLVLLRHRPVTSHTYLLTVLAVADSGVGIAATLHNPISDIARHSYLVTLFCGMFFISFSNWTLVIVSIDRYFTLCRPLHSRRICTVTRARRHVGINIVMSLLYAVLYTMHRMSIACILKVMFEIRIIVIECVPCAIVLIVNLLIIVELKLSERRHARIARGQVTPFCQTHGLIFNLLITNTVFLICVFPQAVLWLLHNHTRYGFRNIMRSSVFICVILNTSSSSQIFNSLVNCFIYVMFFKTFRQTMKLMFMKTGRAICVYTKLTRVIHQ